MFKFIQSFFPYKARSLEDFVRMVKREGCIRVCVEPPHIKGAPVAKLTSKMPHPGGRKVVYLVPLVHLDETEGFLFSEEIVKVLSMKLPNLAVDLVGPDGRRMDDIMCEKWHQAKQTRKISA